MPSIPTVVGESSALRINEQNHLTRQSVIAGIGAAAPAAAFAAGEADADPDSTLTALWRAHGQASGHAAERGIPDEERDRRWDLVADVECAIHDLPAHTPAGLAIKAKIAEAHLLPFPAERDGLGQAALRALLADIYRAVGALAA
jgi:hypothetical protein